MSDAPRTIREPAAHASHAYIPAGGKGGRRLTWRGTLIWAARLVVAAAFVAAAVPKVRDPAGFGQVVQHYQLVPQASVPAIAIILPWLEIVAGLALLAPRHWHWPVR